MIIKWELILEMPKDSFEKEKWAAYMRKYRQSNPDKNKENCKENYQRHKSDRAEYQRKYRKRRKELQHELRQSASVQKDENEDGL